MNIFKKKPKELPAPAKPADRLKLILDAAAKQKKAEHGEYFRTQGFQIKSGGLKNETQYMEALWMKDRRNWTVQKVMSYEGLRLPAGRSTHADDVNALLQSKNTSYVPVKEGVCFFEAMHEVAMFEALPLKGMERQEEDLKSDHYIDFAHKEGLIFDENGLPHLTEGGRPVGKVKIPQSELDELEARRALQKSDEEPFSPTWPGIDALENTFNQQSGGVVDMEAHMKMVQLESCLRQAKHRITEAMGAYKARNHYNHYNHSYGDYKKQSSWKEGWGGAPNPYQGTFYRCMDGASESLSRPFYSSIPKELYQPLKDIQLNFCVLRSVAYYHALRNVQNPKAFGHEESKTDLRKLMDESMDDLNRHTEYRDKDERFMARVNARIIQKREFSDVMDMIKAYETGLGLFLENITKLVDRDVAQASLPSVEPVKLLERAEPVLQEQPLIPQGAYIPHCDLM